MSNTVQNEAIKSAHATATGTLYAAPGRLRGFYIEGAASAGAATFRDGGVGGTTIMVLNTPASATFVDSLDLPGGGIGFGTDLHVTLTNVTSVTVYYAEDRTL